MSSHREAPEVSKDPVVDNTDTYAFVSPDNPETVTIISNYIPAEVPAGGPTFYEFGNDVLYQINIDNDGDGYAEIVYEFRFEQKFANPNTFLYNTGPISSLVDPNWNKRQLYSVVRQDSNGPRVLGENLACPPCNIGPRSTPKYEPLEKEAIHSLPGNVKVFAGQRNDPFFVDIGSIFDLADLRPIENLHLIPTPATLGVDTLETINCHTIAIQVPISALTINGSVPTNVMSSTAVIGVWASASRRKVRISEGAASEHAEVGPWTQVSRLATPLFNEVLIPMSRKDEWNANEPSDDKEYLPFVQHPELAKLLPILYPKRLPALEKLTAPREDLVAILLTGLPAGVVPGFQNASRRGVFADMLRLNVAVPPTKSPKPLGFLEEDLAGYPNGRRITDDVTNISLKAVAGATYPLVNKSYVPDEAVAAIEQGITPLSTRTQGMFPYAATPHGGFQFPSDTE
jgi:Domain of unknown function (DUF4331)